MDIETLTQRLDSINQYSLLDALYMIRDLLAQMETPSTATQPTTDQPTGGSDSDADHRHWGEMDSTTQPTPVLSPSAPTDTLSGPVGLSSECAHNSIVQTHNEYPV